MPKTGTAALYVAAPHPGVGRVFVGLLAALVAGTSAFVAFVVVSSGFPAPDTETLQVLLAIALCAAALTLFVGAPLYYGLRRRLRMSLPVAGVFGGLLAISPILAVPMSNSGLFVKVSGLSVTDPRILAVGFGCGFLGGAAFWLAAYRRNPRLPSARP